MSVRITPLLGGILLLCSCFDSAPPTHDSHWSRIYDLYGNATVEDAQIFLFGENHVTWNQHVKNFDTILTLVRPGDTILFEGMEYDHSLAYCYILFNRTPGPAGESMTSILRDYNTRLSGVTCNGWEGDTHARVSQSFQNNKLSLNDPDVVHKRNDDMIQNIKTVLRKNPDGRVFVLTGEAHLPISNLFGLSGMLGSDKKNILGFLSEHPYLIFVDEMQNCVITHGNKTQMSAAHRNNRTLYSNCYDGQPFSTDQIRPH